MIKIMLSFIAIYFCASCFSLKAQQKSTINTSIGAVKGVVRDSVRKYMLKSATVSVYKVVDSTLMSYQITNNYGEFRFHKLPLETPLRLTVTNIGYHTLSKVFKVNSAGKEVDLDTIFMEQQDITLDNVVISVPPISMNGDTLEFNALAFKLDSNATVEDMLRAIPNVTLWGDGSITVNGSEIKKLKVNGKSFFGGDPKLAIQNIPKNALQKVQVYNTTINPSNPGDSTLEMNLKLRKGIDVGYFGKFSAGQGTNGRFELDGNINAFTPRMQLAIIGALNNVNKVPNSIQTLMSNSTFKGVGTSVEYQPDFREAGINKPAAVGASFSYDFVQDPKYDNKSSLKSNYFLQNKKSDFRSQAVTTTSVDAVNKFFEKTNNTRSSNNTTQRFDSEFTLAKKGKDLNISHSLNLFNGVNNELLQRKANNSQDQLISINDTRNANEYVNKSFNLRADYQYSDYYKKSRLNGFHVTYDLTSYKNKSNDQNVTEFKSLVNANSNQSFDRRYQRNTTGTKQEVTIVLKDLDKLLFDRNLISGLQVNLTNRVFQKDDKSSDLVSDLDTLTNRYVTNTYLNNNSRTNFLEMTPGLRIQKAYYNALSNRYNKTFTILFHPKQILIRQENNSQKTFQNIKRRYSQIALDGGFTYIDNQYGEYSKSVSLNYNNTLRLPTVQEIAPLIDSSNVYYIQRGNVSLRESSNHDIVLRVSHNDERNKNSFNYTIQASAGFVINQIVDSLLVDNQNKRTVFLVNADGYKYISLNFGAKKAFKFTASELQLSVNSNVNVSKSPSYVNSNFTFANNIYSNSGTNINFAYRNLFAVAFEQSVSTYKIKQIAFNSQFAGTNLSTNVSTSFNVTKKLVLNSNATFNNSSSTGGESFDFTIWNASVLYRFLKGNNAEIRFSALDLLNQNSSVINFGSINSFTTGRQNTLNQYFIVALSYYPRQFGKKYKK
jgi:hypothetical protein